MSTRAQQSWWNSLLLGAYDSLTRHDAIGPVDLIFVMAGRMERKEYALKLYRAGLAPHLLLSVGRFEVSKMRKFKLDGLDALVALRDRTLPEERHFFVTASVSGTRVENAKSPRWNTYGEALAFRRFLGAQPAQRVMVVSSDIHLRRVAFTFARVFRGVPVEFCYCPVPSHFGFVKRDGWWTRREDRWLVVQEMVKLAGYRAILSLPVWASRRLFGLKD